MKKSPLVFSIVRDQSLFMTAIMALLTFLSVLALGIALSIGTGVARWNTQWELNATVQVMSESNSGDVTKIINDNRSKFTSVTEISKNDMERMLRPWMSSDTNAIGNYLPKMWEVRFKTKSDMKTIGAQISNHARFLTHASALKNSAGAGIRIIFISVLVLVLVLASIAMCVSHIARNTAQLHKRELEILSQIGARDNFIVRQMQIIVGKISLGAGAIGLAMAMPMLLLILGAAHSSRIGLMAMIGLNTMGWILLILMPIAIAIFAIWITKKTTLKILNQ